MSIYHDLPEIINKCHNSPILLEQALREALDKDYFNLLAKNLLKHYPFRKGVFLDMEDDEIQRLIKQKLQDNNLPRPFDTLDQFNLAYDATEFVTIQDESQIINLLKTNNSMRKWVINDTVPATIVERIQWWHSEGYSNLLEYHKNLTTKYNNELHRPIWVNVISRNEGFWVNETVAHYCMLAGIVLEYYYVDI